MHVFCVTYLNLTRVRHNFEDNLSERILHQQFFLFTPFLYAVFGCLSPVLRKYEHDDETK